MRAQDWYGEGWRSKVAALDPKNELYALKWIEAVSESDRDETR
jgi:hypothetical protein